MDAAIALVTATANLRLMIDKYGPFSNEAIDAKDHAERMLSRFQRLQKQ